MFRKFYEKKYATELEHYTEAKESLKAAYAQSGEKVPTLEELEQKKTALIKSDRRKMQSTKSRRNAGGMIWGDRLQCP